MILQGEIENLFCVLWFLRVYLYFLSILFDLKLIGYYNIRHITPASDILNFLGKYTINHTFSVIIFLHFVTWIWWHLNQKLNKLWPQLHSCTYIIHRHNFVCLCNTINNTIKIPFNSFMGNNTNLYHREICWI